MVVVSVELVEVDVLSLMVGIFFARRVEQAHAEQLIAGRVGARQGQDFGHSHFNARQHLLPSEIGPPFWRGTPIDEQGERRPREVKVNRERGYATIVSPAPRSLAGALIPGPGN